MNKRWTFLVILLTAFVILPGIPRAAGPEKECSWGAVNSYTDGTPIEATKTVYYNAMMDNVLKATRTLNTWFKFTPTDHGVTHYFTAQAELSTGEKSAWSPAFAWISPAGTPTTPLGCSVGDPIH
jgi:hypothetical protein